MEKSATGGTVNCPASASSGVEKKKGLPAEAGNPLISY